MKKWMRKAAVFVFFVLLGFIVFVVFSHMRPMLSDDYDMIGRICLIASLLFGALLARRSDHLKKYWQILFAYFIAVLAMAVDLYLPSSRWLLSGLGIPIDTPAGIALDKLDSSVIIIVFVILLTRLAGGTPSSIYLKKGNLKQGMTIGIIALLVAAAGSVFVAESFGAQDLSLARIVPWIPWIFIFVIGNAFNEELLFRGLFLRKFQPFIGRFLSNLVVAIPFVLHHTGVTYTNDALMFLAYLLPLSLVWGYMIQKTDSLLGSVLFHAGTDIPVVLVIFSTFA